MRFLLCASAITVHVFVLCAALASGVAQEAARQSVNELTLAGLRPGVDTLATAEKSYKAKYRKKDASDGIAEWTDECTGRMLRLELNPKNVIQSVTISALGPVAEPDKTDCRQSARDLLQTKLWRTGRGLRLSDPQHRAMEIYGEPNSAGPATKGEKELEMLFYSFDWAGADVPQHLEVLCDRASGKVVEITLAFPGL